MNTGGSSYEEYVVVLAFAAFIGLYTESLLAALFVLAAALLVKEL